MQDRYVGDIRDFVKYGLLRRLCKPGPERAPPPKLGVVWYRTCPEEVGGQGGGIDCYLDPEGVGCDKHEFCDALRDCDKKLEAALRPIRGNDRRTVLNVENGGILPNGTCFFHDFWTFGGRCGQAERRQKRRALFQGTFDALSGCGLVFLDPDNGIDTTRVRGVSAATGRLKYVLSCEGRRAYDDGARSLVLIQFLSRWRNAGTPAEQVRNRRQNLRDALGDVSIHTAVFCFRQCSGGAQPNPKNGPPLVFFMVPGNGHDEFIDGRLKALVDEKSPWSRFFSLGGGDRPPGGCPDPGGQCDACDA